MIRNIKVLGTALAAAVAIGALSASAVSAQVGTVTSTGPWTGTATENVGTVNTITAFGFSVSCPNSFYTLHKLSETPHKFIPNDVTSVTITPHSNQAGNNCRTNPGNFPTTTDMNGCDYAGILGSTTGTADQYSTKFNVVCPPGTQITWTVFTTAAKEAENKPFCRMHLASQENLNGPNVKDLTNGKIELSGTAEKIKATKTNGGEDPLLCPAAETSEAKVDINVTAAAVNEAGAATSISISHL